MFSAQGLTLDTGALIGLERRKLRAVRLINNARVRDVRLTIPSVVLLEFWRGQRGPVATMVARWEQEGLIEPLTTRLAKIAGEALAKVGSGPSAIDAVVMASAASRGDAVLTSDVADMMRLQAFFPSVRIFGV